VPEALDIPLIVDSYCPHKDTRVRAWQAARPRYHVLYTPTYVSWLNQVERWFALITQRAIRRGSFSSVKDPVSRIEDFTRHSNSQAQPFIWTATADSILAKIGRLYTYINGTSH